MTEALRSAARARFTAALTSPKARHSYPTPMRPSFGAPNDLHARGGQASLYVHVPYCSARCTYCFFVTQIGAGAADMGRYVEEVGTELELLRDSLAGYSFTSLYYGGGTPGLLPAETFRRLHSLIAPFLAPSATVTVETHPHAADAERIKAWRSCGVDRVSMGVQTTDPSLLQLIERGRSAPEILPALERLLEAGFADVNVDLLYGLPDQDLNTWIASVEAMRDLGVPSMSLYRTSYLPDSIKAFRDRGASFPSAETIQEMYEWAFVTLNQSGYLQPRYGSSTFSRLAYPFGLNTHRFHILHGRPMVGVGMGAFGVVQGYSYLNQRTRDGYQSALARRELPVLASAPIPENERPHKYAVEVWKLGFLSREVYRSLFAEEVESRFAPELETLLELGELERVEDEYRLTRLGSSHPDAIADMFVSDTARSFHAGGR